MKPGIRFFTLVAVFCSNALMAAPLTGEGDEVIPYKKVDGYELRLHVFKPSTPAPQGYATAIVCFSGGGWAVGVPEEFYPQCRYWARRGVVAMVAEYRNRKDHKATPFDCVKDGKSAMRYVRSHALHLGVNPDRILAAGGSAGGHAAT